MRASVGAQARSRGNCFQKTPADERPKVALEWRVGPSRGEGKTKFVDSGRSPAKYVLSGSGKGPSSKSHTKFVCEREGIGRSQKKSERRT